VAIGEIIAHFADDAREWRERYPYATSETPWSEAAFLAAIEGEDEPAAQALLRGALGAGLTADDLLPILAEAALAHYADFGHSLIYAVKTVALVRRLGPDSAPPLLAMLVRSIVYATREDLLPEFRDYAKRLAAWGEGGGAAPPFDGAALRRSSPRSALATVAAWAGRHSPERIFAALVGEAAWILLHVDERCLTAVDAKLADNIGWLDFTHALTFAEAALPATASRPALWPAVLLQLACFIGRNAGYVDAGLDEGPYRVHDIPSFLDRAEARLFDHGRERFIISVHLLKTLRAGRQLIAVLPEQAPTIAAALDRFLDAPMKGRHALRTARQMRELVEQE
ncbi:MAG TPA: hypothetical protein VKS60_08940, partial [Stellaceae bacterium]|nr:hypothetical protein [Stellaceae bacterium]